MVVQMVVLVGERHRLNGGQRQHCIGEQRDQDMHLQTGCSADQLGFNAGHHQLQAQRRDRDSRQYQQGYTLQVLAQGGCQQHSADQPGNHGQGMRDIEVQAFAGKQSAAQGDTMQEQGPAPDKGQLFFETDGAG